MAKPSTSGGSPATSKTLLGKVLRRGERRLHAWQVSLLQDEGAAAGAKASKASRLEATRVQRLRRMFEQVRSINDTVTPSLDAFGEPASPSVGKIRRMRREVLMWGAEDAFFRSLTANEPFDVAIITAVRRMVAQGGIVESQRRARSLAQVLQTRPQFADIGDIAMGLVGLADQVPGTSWELLNRVDRELVLRLAPGEYFRTGFVFDPETAGEVLSEIAAGRRTIVATPTQWLEIARSSFVAGKERDSHFALEQARAGATPDDSELIADIEWLSEWYGRAEQARHLVEAPAGTIPFAVLDYKQPDRAYSSTNLGDYVQTIASLGHVVRHKGFSFTGDEELVSVLDELQGRVKSERAIDGEDATLSLYKLDRDATNYFPIPDGTWAIAFGWYMHPMFKLRYDAPLNPRLRPIFISFHVNELGLLSDEMIAYLKKYSPVGCRDWNTVHLLTAAGIPAFFSGCLTTTVDTVFAPGGATGTQGTLWVDAESPGEGDRFKQQFEEVRSRSMVPNVDDALARLESYRSTYNDVVTSRLHCYLPARSIGADVDFRPKNPADVRFDGLAGIDDDAFDAMRQGILDKLNVVMTAIGAGGTEDEVYALWREVCAPAVAEAVARRAALAPIAEPTFDVKEACRVVLQKSRTIERSEPGPAGDEIRIEFSLDGNLKHQLSVVLGSIVAGASRPIRAYVLCRDHDESDYERLARTFPTVSFVWLPTDDVDYGKIIGMITHITVATMDRLLLPELLPEVDKIVHHDLDALCFGDISELHDVELGDLPIAARTSPQPAARNGFQIITQASKRLKKDQSLARELILRNHTRHAFNFAAFNAGIMVLNLERMRADDFCRHFLPFAERFGMNDQEILNAYAGSDRVEIDPDWNRLPRLEIVDNPKIVHWAGFQKPWDNEYVQYQEKWIETDERVTALEAKALGTTAPRPAARHPHDDDVLLAAVAESDD